MSLTKAEILGSALQVREVETPEWGGSVFVRELPGNELQALMDRPKGESDIAYTYRIATSCICDDGGNRLFEDGEHKSLMAKGIAPLQRCIEAALDLNGMTEESQKVLAGNSEPILSESSGSD